MASLTLVGRSSDQDQQHILATSSIEEDLPSFLKGNFNFL
jgi:hypothetical protein